MRIMFCRNHRVKLLVIALTMTASNVSADTLLQQYVFHCAKVSGTTWFTSMFMRGLIMKYKYEESVVGVVNATVPASKSEDGEFVLEKENIRVSVDFNSSNARGLASRYLKGVHSKSQWKKVYDLEEYEHNRALSENKIGEGYPYRCVLSTISSIDSGERESEVKPLKVLWVATPTPENILGK